jgi:hypothetical protein
VKLAVIALLFAAACGPGSKPATTTPDPDPAPPKDTRPPLLQRRDAACKALAPRITQCALDDSKIAAQNGEITQKTLTEISAPEILAKNSKNFIEKCEVPVSSRQLRVLEVCDREAPTCPELLSCLENLKAQPK